MPRGFVPGMEGWAAGWHWGFHGLHGHRGSQGLSEWLGRQEASPRAGLAWGQAMMVRDTSLHLQQVAWPRELLSWLEPGVCGAAQGEKSVCVPAISPLGSQASASQAGLAKPALWDAPCSVLWFTRQQSASRPVLSQASPPPSPGSQVHTQVLGVLVPPGLVGSLLRKDPDWRCLEDRLPLSSPLSGLLPTQCPLKALVQ